MSSFDKALEFTLRWEGGYVFDHDDPGGETKYGISKRAYPNVNIKELTREQAGDIYKRDYWNTFNCDNLSVADACAVFDTCVNCGVARTAIFLDSADHYSQLLDARESYYKDLVKRKPLMTKYLKGWLNRVNSLRSYCSEIDKHTKQ